MKPVVLFVAALTLTAVLAGCSGKTETPPTTTPATTTPTSTPKTTPPTTPTNNTTAPAAPKEILNKTLKYGTTNDPAVSATMDAGVVKVVIYAVLRATAAGAASIQGEPNQSPYVLYTPPSGDATKITFLATTTTSATAGQLLGTTDNPQTKEVAAPVAGAWSIKIYGVGSNAEVFTTMTEKFV